MRARRSRISRLYRKITRRTPNRQAQWKEIHQLRGHACGGAASASVRYQAYLPETAQWAGEPQVEEVTLEEWTTPGDEPVEPAEEAGDKSQTAAVALLSVSLFLLGCAYAALAGYVLAYNAKIASVAVLGGVGALAAAGVGIALSGSPKYHRTSARFLGLSTASMAALYVLLMLTSLGH